jgi:putative DNA primase/helicase
MSDPVEDFRAAIAAAGLTPPKIVSPDGKLHRFASNGDARDKAGWYIFHLDGLPAGAFGDFRSDLSSTWRADIDRKLSPQELADCKARVEAMRRQREAEDAKVKAEARKEAVAIWDAARPAPDDHPYLAKKGIGPHGLRAHEGRLVVPMLDDAGVLHSLHYIAPDGSKWFLTGGRVAGCFYQIGEPRGVICVGEGFATMATVHEATGHGAVAAINKSSLLAVAQSFRRRFPAAKIVLCADDDWMREGNPGLTDARAAAEAVGGGVAVPEFGEGRGEKDTDFNDMARVAGRDAVSRLLERAYAGKPEGGAAAEQAQGVPCGMAEGASADGEATPDLDERAPNGLDAAISALAAMSLAQYERARKDEASRLGVRASILDKLVTAARPSGDAALSQGRQLVLPEPDPWPEPVEGAVLLGELRDVVKKFLVCSPPMAAAIALWIASTWFEPAAQVAPILNIRSPLPRCGKTTLLDLIRRLSKRPLAASSITAAALFRTVEKCCPTLVIDEADSFFSENEEMRGVLNSGHTRQTAFVIRTVGDDHEPRQFSTWGFKAIAGIGKRAGTIEDRSIAIDLERKLRNERISRLRHAPNGLFTALQQKLRRWSSDNGQAIAGAWPNLPDALDDRQQDNWEILVAIAELAGGDWPSIARNASVSLSDGKDDKAPLGGKLLEYVQEIVNTSAQARGIYSQVLLDKLIDMPERPWGECNHGKPLTLNRLAKMMGSFSLKTKSLKIDGTVQRGYGLAELQVTFARYCTPNTAREPDTGFQSATVLPVNDINGLPENQSATSNLENNEALPHVIMTNQGVTNKGSRVALQTPQTGDGDESSVDSDLEGFEF